MANVKDFASKYLTEHKRNGNDGSGRSVEIYVRLEGRDDRQLQVSIGPQARYLGPLILQWIKKISAMMKGSALP